MSRNEPPPSGRDAALLFAEESEATRWDRERCASADPAERQEARQSLWLRYQDDLFRYAIAKARDVALGQDVVNALYAAMMLSYSGCKPIGRYLARSVCNAIRKHHRTEAAFVALDTIPEPLSCAADVCEEAIAGQEAQILRQRFLALNEKTRQIVLLRLVERMSFKDIAKHLRIAASSAHAHYQKAIRDLFEIPNKFAIKGALNVGITSRRT